VQRLCQGGISERLRSGFFFRVGRTSEETGSGNASGGCGCTSTLCYGTGGLAFSVLRQGEEEQLVLVRLWPV
jgi:hypothetical protein